MLGVSKTLYTIVNVFYNIKQRKNYKDDTMNNQQETK